MKWYTKRIQDHLKGTIYLFQLTFNWGIVDFYNNEYRQGTNITLKKKYYPKSGENVQWCYQRDFRVFALDFCRPGSRCWCYNIVHSSYYLFTSHPANCRRIKISSYEKKRHRKKRNIMGQLITTKIDRNMYLQKQGKYYLCREIK